MYKYLKKLNIKTIYQNIDEVDNKSIEKFVKDLKDNCGVETYALAGDPSWYENDLSIKEALENIDNYNEGVKDRYKIKGIVLDIEPWTAYESWNRETYVKNMKKAYEYSKGFDIMLITVIPVWLDPSDLDIIIKCCDKIAIMNYNIDFPIDLIKEEIYIAKKYKKEVDIIAEIQPPNEKYGVQKNTTYYYEGYDKLQKDWNTIKDTYKYNKINFSYHDYGNIKEFIKLE